jgi:hypothetical protein
MQATASRRDRGAGERPPPDDLREADGGSSSTSRAGNGVAAEAADHLVMNNDGYASIRARRPTTSGREHHAATRAPGDRARHPASPSRRLAHVVIDSQKDLRGAVRRAGALTHVCDVRVIPDEIRAPG